MLGILYLFIVSECIENMFDVYGMCESVYVFVCGVCRASANKGL